MIILAWCVKRKEKQPAGLNIYAHILTHATHPLFGLNSESVPKRYGKFLVFKVRLQVVDFLDMAFR